MTDLYLKRTDSPDIAYTWNKGKQDLCVLYLHGWNAHRKSRKGFAVAETAAAAGAHYLAPDYTAHGESGGKPDEFTIGQGLRDIEAVLDATVGHMPLLIVGNSIGGWLGLLVAEKRQETVGFLGLAPAPDIIQTIWDKMLPPMAKAAIKAGKTLGPSPETEGFCLTKQLFEDSKSHLMLNRPIHFSGPVRLLKGDKDNRVEMDRLYRIRDNLISRDVLITLIKESDHHLSSEKDINLIQENLTLMLEA